MLNLVGQRVNEIKLDEQSQKINIFYVRDRRKIVIDPVTGD
jgi:hypothetical protein